MTSLMNPPLSSSEPRAQRAHQQLLELIDRGRATVAIVGLGYVGLPLLAAVADAGYPAIGIDRDAEKIEKLRRGENYLPHLGDEMAKSIGTNRRVKLAAERAALRDADVVLICVPTPLTDGKLPDLSYVEDAARDIRRFAIEPEPERARLVVLESTTYPGTTRDVLLPILEGGEPADEHGGGGCDTLGPSIPGLFCAFSPEREDPANKGHTTRTIPKLVGGVDEASLELAVRLYGKVVERVVPCSSAEVAEAAKLVENIYRAVNIALVNELKVVFERMGIDIWEVLDAAATKPFGFQRFNPGPGWGGHCVPIDPYYLTWKARQLGEETRFIELAGEINRRMPFYVVEKCAEALRSRGMMLEGARVLVLGLAYKANVGDVRESPSFELIELLRRRGAKVEYHDPYVARTWKGRRHDVQMSSVPFAPETISSFDLVLISTDHDWYDWDLVGRHARLIVDTRNAMRAVESAAGKVWKA